MSDHRFVLLLLALLAGSCIGGGGRQFILTKLQNSPLGIGVHSALDESSWTKRRGPKSIPAVTTTQSCNEQSDEHHQSRFASVVHRGEAEALGLALPPYLKRKRKSNQEIDTSRGELDYLEEGVVPCSTGYAKSNIIHANRRSAASTTMLPPGVSSTAAAIQTSDRRGNSDAVIPFARPLVFWENMVCGAISRSIAQTVMHPANTMKTILQSTRGADRPTLRYLMRPQNFKTLTRGAGANFILSVPHGAINFAVLEFVSGRMSQFVSSVPWLEERKDSMGAGLDFVSSAISTICCSIVSTPQMMITDNIMAGNYPRLTVAARGLYAERGVLGLYAGWWPGLVGKIPSYVSFVLF
jgi:hypothetical protein